MAYYTVAHFLQAGSFDGGSGSPYGIKYEYFHYINGEMKFLKNNVGMTQNSGS
jgi:hypothetical protein